MRDMNGNENSRQMISHASWIFGYLFVLKRNKSGKLLLKRNSIIEKKTIQNSSLIHLNMRCSAMHFGDVHCAMVRNLHFC